VCCNVQKENLEKKKKNTRHQKAQLPWANMCHFWAYWCVESLHKNATNLIVNVQQASKMIKMPKIFSIVYFFSDRAFYKKSNFNQK
jgi:hypothetical protein